MKIKKKLWYIHNLFDAITFFTVTYPLTVGDTSSITDDFTISFLHFSLFSTALWGLVNSRPVHSLMLSSHLFFCLLCLLPPFTARWFGPDLKNGRQSIPLQFALVFFTNIRRSSCGPIVCWILAQTSSLVTWPLFEMHNILR